jgi:hypothetical protein
VEAKNKSGDMIIRGQPQLSFVDARSIFSFFPSVYSCASCTLSLRTTFSDSIFQEFFVALTTIIEDIPTSTVTTRLRDEAFRCCFNNSSNAPRLLKELLAKMPKQHVLFGRPISSRRISQLFGGIVVFAIVTLFYSLHSSVPGPSLSKFTDGPRISLPKLPKTFSSPNILHPFRPAAHAPPVQENSTSGDASWYTAWNWLSPFSSSVTLDEDRSLLPPLKDRPPIYTYYDYTLKDSDIKTAESEILVTWRKAWWAQGFKPIILGPAEAMANPLYEILQQKKYGADLQEEMAKWMAWESMGKGILCHYLVLPMGPHEDSLLSYLRRGDYPKLTRYEGMGSNMFSGNKAEITAVLKAALDSKDLGKTKDIIKSLPKETFAVDPSPAAIALYDLPTLKSKYAKVSEGLTELNAKGLKTLRQLMNAHLHHTWQNVFSQGILVLKPCPEHTTALVEPAKQLANFLAECPVSPIPSSCPPNIPNCRFCVAKEPMKISTPEQYQNESSLYVIGTVPHPYTRISLHGLREKIDVPYIRRSTARDQWLYVVTKHLLGTGVSSSPRVVKFKEAVASPYGAARSIWFTAEMELPNDLDWHFGFSIPKTVSNSGKSETPVPGPERRPKDKEPDPVDGPIVTEQDLVIERKLLAKAQLVATGKAREIKGLNAAVEAWNLADGEAWKFARAYLARSRMERLRWEQQEKDYAGGAGVEAAKKQGWGRWFDRRSS